MRDQRIPRVLTTLHAFRPARRCRQTPLNVSASEATALRDAIATLMSGYGDIAIAVDDGQWVDVRRWRWTMECLARLLDDLGWSNESSPAAITAPAAQLLVALEAISYHCSEMLEADRQEIATASDDAERYRDSLTICTSLGSRIEVVIGGGAR